VQNKNSNK